MTQSNDVLAVSANTTDAAIEAAIENASSVERVTKYNELTGKAIKKFATKAAGAKQLAKAMIAERDRLSAEAPAEPKSDDLSERLDEAAKKRRTGGAKHDPSRYRSAYVKDQLLAGRTDYDAIATEAAERFPDVITQRKHVTWYRWQLRKAGYNI